jgi:organic hydroperoxide reductase OsmC/OhrA
MQSYPHTYVAAANGTPSGPVPVASPGVPELATTAPPQFDGPEGYWSPETMLTGSVANCFILTFRAVSRSAKLEWLRVECKVEAVLEKVDGITQFSRFDTLATLTVAPGADTAKAKQLLERAEHGCLVANSLRGTRTLDARVVTTPDGL